jgi:Lrp/AsnC family leucine-responsive transcriptional regulator
MKLDKKDMELLYWLDRDSREPASSIAKRMRASKEVVAYRIGRLLRQGVIKKFYTIIDVGRLGFASHKIYMQFQNLDAEKEKEIVDFLVSRPQIYWVATCSGKWDLMIGSWARNVMDFNDNVLEPVLDRYSPYILNKEVTITRHNTQQNRRWFHECSEKAISSVVGGEPKDVRLDKLDVKILNILKNEARAPTAEIARKVKANPMVVAYRIKKLRKDEVIQSFRIAVDLEKAGYEFCKAFLYLKNLNKQKLAEFVNYCKSKKNILNIVTCVGPWDLELEFEVGSFEEFHSQMKDIREKFGDIIKNYESVLISKELRVDFMPENYEGF